MGTPRNAAFHGFTFDEAAAGREISESLERKWSQT
jgi:hypothetical protein